MLPYIKGVSETRCRTLQQQGIRTVFKSDTTLRSRLVRPKDPADSKKPDGLVYRIPCKCSKVYIRETGRPMQERIKEHNRDIRLARTQSSAISEHANEIEHNPLWEDVKFIDWNSHCHTRRVKEAIHIRLNPHNINRENGFKIIIYLKKLIHCKDKLHKISTNKCQITIVWWVEDRDVSNSS